MSLESSDSTIHPDILIHAKSGSLTEVIGDVFASIPLKFRRRPTSTPSSSSSNQNDHLSSIVSKITIKDIQGARRCGGGGFGAVLTLEHPTKGKVALKQLSVTGGQGGDDLRRRTLREGDTWRGLKHPYVLPFLGVLATPNDLYLISPYVNNGSLSDYIRQHPNADRRKFLSETASAIAYLHECGIVHGDIKASNILVSDDIHALLCDFGLARPETMDTSVGLKGVGSTPFQSPEILHGGEKTPASDAWAFGMTIYEVLSGKIPFHRYNNLRVIHAIANINELPVKSPTTSPLGVSYDKLWSVASDCWKRDPAERLSMRDAQRRLCYHPMALEGHTGAVNCCAFSPNGKTIVSGSDDHTLRLWDTESGEQIGEALKGHASLVVCVAFSPDGRTIVSAGSLCSPYMAEQPLRLWDAASRQQLPTAFKGLTSSVRCVAFSPDGETFVSGSANHALQLWDPKSGSQRGGNLWGHTDSVTCVAFSRDGTIIVSGSADGTIGVWNVAAVNDPFTLWKAPMASVACVALSLDGGTILAGSRDSKLLVWDEETGGRLEEWLPVEDPTQPIRFVAFQPDGRIILGYFDHTTLMCSIRSSQGWSFGRGKCPGLPHCLTLSPDCKTMAAGCKDGTIELWNI